jgi:hypothetical protein
LEIPARPIQHSRRCRYRVEQLEADHFAVVERMTGKVVVSDFTDYRSAWCWIATALSKRREE